MTRRIRRGRVLAAVVVLAAVGVLLGGLALSRSSLLRARTLRVVGAEVRPGSVLLREAGLNGSSNVLYVDEDAAIRALLSADPWIRDAHLERDLPSTLILHVRERVPVAVVGEDAVAADGTSLPGGEIEGLPTIRTTTGADPDAVRIADAAATLRSLPGMWRRLVVSVIVLPDRSMHLVTSGDAPTIVWGTRGLAGDKVVALRAVSAWATQKGRTLQLVDVSVPTTPAARLTDGSIVIP